MELRVKKCAKLNQFTQCELEEIADSLEVVKETNCREVYFSKYPPQNHGLPWQQLDDEGRNLGTIKYYINGKWT